MGGDTQSDQSCKHYPRCRQPDSYVIRNYLNRGRAVGRHHYALPLKESGITSTPTRICTDDKFQIRRESRPSIMINPLTKGDETSAALAVVKATAGQKAGLLSLAGDALCFAVTALRLSESTPRIPKQKETNENHPTISLDQVSWHDHRADCWVVVYDQVYDITEFLLEHAGGEEILLEYAGRDATLAFRGIGHEAAMLQTLERYLLGVLPESERIYSTLGGKLAGLRRS